MAPTYVLSVTVYPWYPMSAHTFVNSHCVKSSLNVLIRVCHSAPRGLQLIKDSYSYSKRSHRSWQGNDCFLKTFSTMVVNLESCGEPAWGPLPMAKVMRKEARHTQRRDWASGVPLEILEHLPPKPEFAYFTTLCSHLHLWLYGGLSPTTSFGEGVNLELQLIIIPGQECFNLQTPLKFL